MTAAPGRARAKRKATGASRARKSRTAKPKPPGASRARKPRTAKPKTSGASRGSKPRKARAGVVLLSGGNPQIAKAEGDAPVQAYIAALSGWQRALAKRLDALVVRSVPGVRKAVKWNSPMYGVEGQGWFLSIHTFTRYLKLAFFRGTSLRPMPPGESKSPGMRYLDLHEDDALDEAQLASWLKQAAALPGWVTNRAS